MQNDDIIINESILDANTLDSNFIFVSEILLISNFR